MKKIIVVALMAALILAAGCKRTNTSGATGTADPPFEGEPPQDAYVFEGEPGVYGGRLVMALPDAMKTFNPIMMSESSSADVLQYHVFRCLVDYRNGEDPPKYDPGVCTRWESTPDGKQWTFYLRRGVRWSDGAPFNADDVVFTYNVIVDSKLETPGAQAFHEGKDESGKPIYPELVKIDDYTVQFNLHQSNAGFLDAVINLYLIPRHKWEAAWSEGKFAETMRVSDDPNNVVSLGPFRIKEYVSDQRVVLERNPYFWKVDKKGQRLPYLDRIIFVIAKSFNTVQAKFEAGEIDLMTRVRPEDYALVKRLESPGIKVQDIGISLDSNWLVINQNMGVNPQTRKPFVAPWKLELYRNQKFRQAVSFAIDRQGLANTVYAGRAVPIYSFVTQGDKTWYTDDIMKYPHDPARARQLLAEVGLKDNNGDGFLEDSKGNTVELNVSANASNSQRTGTATFIAQNLQAVGIKSSFAPLAFNVVTTVLEKTFDYDGILLGWQTGVPPGPINAKNIVLSSGPQHACFPNQKSPSAAWETRADELMHEVIVAPTDADRKRLFAEIQRIWSEYLPEINLVAAMEAVAYKDVFGNLKPTPLPPRLSWNCEEIYLRN